MTHVRELIMSSHVMMMAAGLVLKIARLEDCNFRFLGFEQPCLKCSTVCMQREGSHFEPFLL